MSMSIGPSNNPYYYTKRASVKKEDDSPKFNPNEPAPEKVLHGHVKVTSLSGDNVEKASGEKGLWDTIIDWIKFW